MKFLKALFRYLLKGTIALLSAVFVCFFIFAFILYRGPVDLTLTKKYIKDLPYISQHLQNFDTLTLSLNHQNLRLELVGRGITITPSHEHLQGIFIEELQAIADPLGFYHHKGLLRALTINGIKVRLKEMTTPSPRFTPELDFDQDAIESTFLDLAHFDNLLITNGRLYYGSSTDPNALNFMLSGKRTKQDFDGTLKLQEIKLSPTGVPTTSPFDTLNFSLVGKITTKDALAKISFYGKVKNLSGQFIEKIFPRSLPDNMLFSMKEVRFWYDIDRPTAYHQAKITSSDLKFDYLTNTNHLFQFHDTGFIAELKGKYFTINLANLSYQDLSFPLSIYGKIDEDKDTLALKVHTNLDDIRLENLNRLWPKDLANDARNWVIHHIPSGFTKRLSLDAKVVLNFSGKSDFVYLKELTSHFHVENLMLSYLDSMPKIENLSCDAHLTKKDLKFINLKGRSHNLNLTNGSVDIDWSNTSTMLSLNVGLQGSMKDTFAILDHPPLSYISKNGLSPKETQGRISGTLHMLFPLNSTLVEHMKIDFKGQTQNLEIQNFLGPNKSLKKGSFSVLYSLDQGLHVTGKATLINLPVDLDYTSNTTGKKGGSIAGTLDTEAHLAPFYPNLVPFVNGAIPFEIHYKNTATDSWHLDLKANLKQTQINTLFYLKESGQSGTLETSLDLFQGSLKNLSSFSLSFGESRKITGTLGKAPNGLYKGSFDISGTSQQENTPYSANLLFKELSPAHYGLKLTGSYIPLYGIKALEKPKNTSDADSNLDFILRIEGKRLALGGKFDFENIHVQGDYKHQEFVNFLLSSNIHGLNPSQSRLKVQLEKNPTGKRTLKLITNSAGEVLSAFDLNDSLKGGEMYLLMIDDPEFKAETWEGRLLIRNFILKDAPTATKFFAILIPTGISSLTQEGGMKFKQLKASFGLTDSLLKIHALRAWGPSTGISLQGSIDRGSKGKMNLSGAMIPAYAMNTLISKIPLLGNLITGGPDDGLLATHFKVTGTTSNPLIEANPLTTITPGVLKGLFSEHIRKGQFDSPWLDDNPESDNNFQNEFKNMYVF